MGVPTQIASADSTGAERAWRRPYLLAAGLLLASVLALAVDVPVARFCRAERLSGQRNGVRVPGDVKKLLTLSEAFGHGMGVGLICLAWFALDRSRRWSLARVLACAYGSGLLADVVKLLVARTRPNALVDLSGGVRETFVGWLPLLHVSELAQAFDRNIHSFPSGHSATAAGLAVVLGSFYPHARWLFALLAALVLLQRVESGAHFVSDVCAGAALGCLWAGLCIDHRMLGRWFDRLERPR